MTTSDGLEVELYVVVSTVHLSATTAAAMTTLPIICDATEYRFRVPIASALENAEALPADLVDLLSHVAQRAPDAYGVMIDCDGPVLDGLVTFDWQV